MVEAGELELIKSGMIFKTYFRSSWGEAMEAFIEVTKLIEAISFLFKLRLGASIGRFVARSVCLSVGLSVKKILDHLGS